MNMPTTWPDALVLCVVMIVFGWVLRAGLLRGK